jgi:hypothetical protein
MTVKIKLPRLILPAVMFLAAAGSVIATSQAYRSEADFQHFASDTLGVAVDYVHPFA